jgi:hypothetical protein
MPLPEPPLTSTWADRWEQRFGPWGTALLVGVLTQLLSFLCYSHFWNNLDASISRLGRSYAPLCEDPWRTEMIAEPQIRHRLLAPVLAWLVGLRGMEGVAIPILAITAIGVILYRLLRDRGLPANLAVVTTLLLGTTPVIITSQAWLGCVDSLGYLGIALCLYCRRIWPLGLIMFVTMLGEERAITAAPLILLWHFTQEEPGSRRWINAILRAAHLVASLGLWYIYFQWIKATYIEPYIATAPANIQEEYAWTRRVFRGEALRQQFLTVPSGVYYAFRAAYLLPILLVLLWWPRRWWEAALAVLAFGLGLIPAILVFDVTRATAYTFPFILLAVVHLYRAGSQWTAYAVLGCCLVNFLTPAYMTTGRFHAWVVPLPVYLIKLVLGL